MQSLWTPSFLMRRIDRCYLVASWARSAERRLAYLELARHYRRILTQMRNPASFVPFGLVPRDIFANTGRGVQATA